MSNDNEWVVEYESRDRMTRIEHLDGVAWHDAPLPGIFFHGCSPQTRGWVDLAPVLRCACGAYSSNGRTWVGRHSRRADLRRQQQRERVAAYRDLA